MFNITSNKKVRRKQSYRFNIQLNNEGINDTLGIRHVYVIFYNKKRNYIFLYSWLIIKKLQYWRGVAKCVFQLQFSFAFESFSLWYITINRGLINDFPKLSEPWPSWKPPLHASARPKLQNAVSGNNSYPRENMHYCKHCTRYLLVLGRKYQRRKTRIVV